MRETKEKRLRIHFSGSVFPVPLYCNGVVHPHTHTHKVLRKKCEAQGKKRGQQVNTRCTIEMNSFNRVHIY